MEPPTKIIKMENDVQSEFNEAVALSDRKRKYSRSTGPAALVSPKRISAFLVVLGRTGNMFEACRAGKIARSFPDYYAQRSPSFARRMAAALENAKDRLETEARRRAVEGWDDPVFGRSKDGKMEQIGTIRKYSDKLLEILLKGAKPNKYASLHGKVEVTHQHTIDLTDRLNEAKDRLKAINVTAKPVSEE